MGLGFKCYKLKRGYKLKVTLMTIPLAHERATAYVILAIGFLIVGLGSMLLGNVPVAAGLLVATLMWLLASLFHLTKENRQKRI